MYTWLRDTVFNALPDDLKVLVKDVNKYTSAGGTAELPALNTVSSKLFCFSEVEITGANTNSRVDEGQQYPIWTKQFSLSSATYMSMNSVIWVSELDMFIAIGNVSNSGVIYISYTGIHWKQVYTSAKRVEFRSICWSPELRMLATIGTIDGELYTSENGIRWENYARITTAADSLYSICWSSEKGLFVAAGYGASNIGVFYSSDDGSYWSLAQRNTIPSMMQDVYWSKDTDLFIAVGYENHSEATIYTSTNGYSWTKFYASNVSNTGLYSICWSPYLTTFVCGGGSSTPTIKVLHSPLHMFYLPTYNDGIFNAYIKVK